MYIEQSIPNHRKYFPLRSNFNNNNNNTYYIIIIGYMYYNT